MTLRRAALALAMTTTLALTACGGSDTAGDSSSSSTSQAPETTGTSSPGGSASTGAGDSSASGASETTASPSSPQATALDPAAANTQLGNLYRSLITARSGSTSAPALQTAVFSGRQLQVAKAAATMRGHQGNYLKPDADAAKKAPVMVALSRTGSAHKMLVGQGQPVKAATPEIYLAEGTSAGSLRITHSASMLPDRRIGEFEAPAAGTVEVPETYDKAAISPAKLMQSYTAYMAYPEPQAEIEDQLFANDPYIQQVEKSSRQTATDLGDSGDYTMKHTLVPGSLRAFVEPNGSLLVFAHVNRAETMSVRDGATIQAPQAVQLLNPKLKTITKQVTLNSDVTLVFRVSKKGKADLAAGTEQLLTATGS